MEHVSRCCKPRGRWAVALVVAAALALAACGGGSSGTKRTSSGATTTTAEAGRSTTTTAKSTTTTEPKIKATAQTISGTLTAADMGNDWKDYPDKPKGTSATGGSSSCVPKGATDAGKAIEARSDGKILQKGSYARYVQTSTYQFPDGPHAAAFVEQRLTDAWIECARSETEKSYKGKYDIVTFGVDRVKQADAAFRGQYSLDIEETVKGKAVSDGFTRHFLYLKGPLVVDVFIQEAQQRGDPDKLGDTVITEISTAMDKVVQRIFG